MGNISIYYDPRRIRTKKFTGPDFFVVLNIEPKERTSWTVWQENNRYPNLIVEILSPKTARTDKLKKKLLYQNTFRTPEYFHFSPRTLEFKGFRLIDNKYKKIKPTAQGRLWSQELGMYLGVHERFIRYFTVTENLVPTPEEYLIESEQRAAEATLMRKIAEQRAAQAALERALIEQRAAEAKLKRTLTEERAAQSSLNGILMEQRVAEAKLKRTLAQQSAVEKKLAAKLCELGIDPNSI